MCCTVICDSSGIFETLGWVRKLERVRGFGLFRSFVSASVKSIMIGAVNKIEGCDWLRGKLDSSAAEGCHGCQVPVGLHCKSTH